MELKINVVPDMEGNEYDERPKRLDVAVMFGTGYEATKYTITRRYPNDNIGAEISRP